MDTTPTTTPALRIYLLGDIRIIHHDHPIPPPPYRTHSLFVAILLHPRPLRREELAGWFFPELPERTGRRRLSDMLWHLRHECPYLPVETSRHDILLPPESRWLDVEAFSRATNSQTLSQWLEAIALYRGSLLTGTYADWILEQRENLYLCYVKVLHQASTQLAQNHHFAEVIPLAEKLCQIEPYDEKALRLLMRAYQAVGRRGAALAAYERFVAIAADELGVQPDVATQALAQAFRSDSLMVTIPPTLHSHTVTPETLWQRAQQALAQGERITLETCLQQLRALSLESAGNPVDKARLVLLEIDAALFKEKYAQAAQLLAQHKHQSAPLKVRAARLAMAHKQRSEALALASQALITASDTQDKESELQALRIMAQIQCETGKGVQAARTAQHALELAQASASAAHVAAALMVQGRLQINMGNDAEALRLFNEARALAQEHGLRPILAEALYKLSVIHSDLGELLTARDTATMALSLWRDLGLKYGEICTAESLALYHALLGDSAECLRILENTSDIAQALGDPVRIAIHQYHLADTLIYHDDTLAPRAIDEARQALSIFEAHDQPAWAASTLTTLSNALWLSGRYAEALTAARDAEALHRKLEEINFLPGVQSLQGLIHLDLDAPKAALVCTQQALQVIMLGSPIDSVLPEVYYAHGMALLAHDDEAQANSYFNRAYQHLVKEAAQHTNEAARQALFHRSPITRRLMAEVRTRGLAPALEANIITRELPAAQGSSPVQIRWTVDAGPADAALKHAQGAIALRRTRVQRLQREAAAQGAHPTIAQLAEALDVSTRTIKRDLAALRESNY